MRREASAVLAAGRHYLRDGDRSVVPVGVHFVPPSGPDWPWRAGLETFDRAFAQMAALGLDSVRIDVLWSAVEPEPGCYDDAHLERLDAILDAARRHGLRLHPVLFIGGEVGDAVWDPAWRGDRDPHADPELRRLQAAHAGMLARRWREEPAILAWDLTDEPPSWLFKDTGDDAARAWTAEVAGAIRGAGAVQLVTIGTASQEVDHGPFRADVVAGELDFACVHPYPIYSPELYPDGLLAARMTRAGAFETALAAGAGQPVMVHEYGASSTQFAPELIAAYDRLLSWSSFGRGAIGFFPWCWTDAEPAAYDRAPYVRMPHETQFGVTDHTGAPRPRARVLGDLAATLCPPRPRRLRRRWSADHTPRCSCRTSTSAPTIRPPTGCRTRRPDPTFRPNRPGTPSATSSRWSAPGSTRSCSPPGRACPSGSRGSRSTGSGRRRDCCCCPPR